MTAAGGAASRSHPEPRDPSSIVAMIGAAAVGLGAVASLGLAFGWLGALGGLVGALALGGMVVAHVVEAGPDEILVISGRTSPYRLARGRVLLRPFIERVDRLSLIRVPLHLTLKVFRSEGIFQVSLDARFAINPKEPWVHRAIERFAGRPPVEVETVARDVITGVARDVLTRASTPPKEWLTANFPMEFAIAIMAFEDDFNKLGLSLYDLDVTAVRAVEGERSAAREER